jgi:predicted transcriptional regulator
MARIGVEIEAPFGKIYIEAEKPQELLKILEEFQKDFIERVSKLISEKLELPLLTQMKGLLEFSREGPLIVTSEKLTHYEAIGLILYGSKKKESTSMKVKKLLKSSGIKSMVSARLNEMNKRGLVFKPDPKKPLFKLTQEGERFVEDTIAKVKVKVKNI